MTDRELIEAAAKAAGYVVSPTGRTDGNFLVLTNNDGDFVWNPLTDDGDAFRLACKLGVTIDYEQDDRGNEDAAWAYREGSRGTVVAFGADRYAATRRAIVRAAAAIGGQKP